MTRTNRTSLLRPAGIVALFAAAGCSLLGNYSTSQCTTDPDCEAIPGLSGYQCVAGQCTARQLPLEAGPDTSAPKCTNDACVKELKDQPAMCQPATGKCVPLQSTLCPVVLGQYTAEDPIYLGFVVPLRKDVPGASPSVLNVKLAIDEINDSGGIRLANAPRKLVAVFCDKSDRTKVQDAAKYLMDEVHVPAIVGQIESAELKTLVPVARDRNVLLYATLANDDSLTSSSFDDGALLWHGIGDMATLGPAYKAAVTLQEQRARAAGATGDIKVAAIVGNAYETKQLAEAAKSVIRFNDKTVAENSTNWIERQVDSLYANPNADYSAVVAELASTIHPNVVIGFGGDEIGIEIIKQLEQAWPATGPARPYYVASPLNRYNVSLYAAARNAQFTNFRKRFAGVEFAGDEELYQAYAQRFRVAFSNARDWQGFHYLYDSVYTIAYAILGAGNSPELRGKDIARGMQKLTGGQDAVTAPKNPRDPSDTNAFLSATIALGRGLPIALRGTTGTYAWDFGSGSRTNAGASVYCITSGASGTEFRWNALTLEGATLKGSFDCQ